MLHNFKLSTERLKSLYNECRFQYSRSSGPGGQKVNKTETRVELIWEINKSYIFNEDQKSMICKKLNNRLNKAGEIIFYSDRYRTRPQNQDHCFRKLASSLEKALSKRKARKKTKPTRGSVEKRIKEKKQHSDKKKMRQKVY